MNIGTSAVTPAGPEGRGRPGWAATLLGWALVLAGMLSVNLPWPPDPGYVTLLAAAVAGAAALLDRMPPPAALAYTLALAQWDGRLYAAAALAAYLAGRRDAAGPPLPALAAVAVLTAGAAALQPEPVLKLAVLPAEVLGTTVVPWIVGRYQHQRRALDEAGWERADRLERERSIVAERTRLRERARIAQDMHDSLGHELSLLAIRAAALEYAAGLSEPQRRQAAELRAGAARATERLHDVIGVLREDGGPAAPVTPPDESLETLVDRARSLGLDVVFRSDAPPVAPPPMVGHALHRIAQEALTNAAKHAPGTRVRVVVTATADATAIRIDNGPPAVAPAAVGSGRGLPGIRERARLLGGELTAGPLPGGGFRVAARLPHHAALPAPGPEPAAVDRAARQRRTLRLGFAKALALTGAGLVLAASVYVFVEGTPSLDDDAYARMRVGQSRDALAETLPERQTARRPEREPPAPAGAVCEYYGAGGSLLPGSVYRLCFRDGHLVAKDRIPLDPDGEDGR